MDSLNVFFFSKILNNFLGNHFIVLLSYTYYISYEVETLIFLA